MFNFSQIILRCSNLYDSKKNHNKEDFDYLKHKNYNWIYEDVKII